MNFLGANPAVEQKKSVKFNAGNEDCFYKGTNCDMTGWPILFQHGFDFRKTMNEALSLDDLKDQIYTKKKPVAVSWHYMGGKGHMALAFGYCLINGKYSIDFNDPDFSGQDYKNPTGQYYQLPYDFYLTGNYKNNHWNDFYDITNTQ